MTTNTNAALRSAAESALEALEILNGIDIETESVTIHVSDEIAALRAALTAAAAPAAVAGPSAPTLERLREWEKNGELMERVWGTLVEQENEIKRLTAAPTTQAAPQREVFDEDGFRAWVIRNLPDNTIIGNSTWWAGHLAAWVQRFMLAAPQAAPVAQGDALPRDDFAWMVVQEACETEPADEDDPECIRILRRDLKSAVLSAFLRHDAAHPAAPVAQGDALTQAARDVLAERQRQIIDEGWTPEHDDKEHLPGELALAAASYLCADERDAPPAIWPWDWSWWKPRDRRRNLIKSGALILAEIERIDRAQAKEGGA